MSRSKSRIKAGDTVIVTAGRDKKKIGKVLRVFPAKGLVTVEGVRVVKRHQKPTGDQPGTIVRKEAPIDISNVAYWNEAEGRRAKIGYAIQDGKKVRIDRASGAALDNQ